MLERAGRTTICSIVFLDIARYSEAVDALQLAMKDRLNAAIAEAVAGIAEQERVILDTGDGAAICFLGDPEDALFAATAINQALRAEAEDGAPPLRTGINLGPVKLVTDLNGRPNVVGDGVNVAQRVMSFAEIGEILVSRSYYEVVARLREGNERLFRYMGSKRDKHVREHQLYAFSLHAGAPHPCAPAQPDESLTEAASDRLPGSLLAAEERRLAAYIGPLARVIVRRTAESAHSPGELCSALAAAILDPADRASFLAGAPEALQLADAVPAEGAVAAVAPATSAALGADELAAAERRLASYIGPLAPLLVRRAARDAGDRHDFYARLSASIANRADRAAFLATADE
jgi:class 3 adenylate cyclase